MRNFSKILLSAFFLSAAVLLAQEKDDVTLVLPGTEPLDWSEKDGEEMTSRLLSGADAFVDRKIQEALAKTPRLPLHAQDSAELAASSRSSLAFKLGVVDTRSKPRLEFVSDDSVSAQGIPGSTLVAKGEGFEIHQVRWQVLPEFLAEGLYVNPIGNSTTSSATPLMVLMPDADETPEDLIGLSDHLGEAQQMARHFAQAGFRILIPAPINRRIFTGLPPDQIQIKKSHQSHREWIYRQAFQMGRHPLGYDIQTMLAGVDWLITSFPGHAVTVAGYGEGGRAALYAAALDTRIAQAFVSGAFASRDRNWTEPIDRHIFRLIPEHGDSAVAALIADRTLFVEHTKFPEVRDRKGELTTPSFSEVQKEWRKIAVVTGEAKLPPTFHLSEAVDGVRGDRAAIAEFVKALAWESSPSISETSSPLADLRRNFDPEARHARIFLSIQRHIHRLIEESDHVRDEYFLFAAEPKLREIKGKEEKSIPPLDPTEFIANSKRWREDFEQNYLGVFDEALLPIHPRSRRLQENDHWTMWEVGLDVYPEFNAWGLLLIPKGIQPGEKRAAVVCQHGRTGVPHDLVDRENPAYNGFAAQLADLGYITWVPLNLRGKEDRYRILDRKAGLIGASHYSFFVASHRQHIAWLKSLPQVDAKRIALYGLSYGGRTAERIPAVIPDYCLSICSGDFNQWTRKVADPEFPKSPTILTPEWMAVRWNLGNTYDHSEMAALIFPRPFFVERGHYDGVSDDSWVAYEYAKVRRLYDTFGLSDRTGIEFFLGGHSIRGEGSFQFLEKHLGKP